MKLNDLIFKDCVIVGFSRDAARHTLTLTFEAYQDDDFEAEPALYTLECYGVSEVRLKVNAEFPADLNRPYDSQGNDQRANEIHELRRDVSGHVHISADMIKGSFHCHECRLLRVMQVEAAA